LTSALGACVQNKFVLSGLADGQRWYNVPGTVEVFAQTAEYHRQDRQTDKRTKKSMELPMSQVEQGPAARRWTRHKIDVRLKVSFRNDEELTSEEPTSAFGRANSLSHGGIGAYIPCTIPVGTTVSLELTFPYSSIEARLNAVVRTCEGFRYGLEFTRVSDAVKEMIVKNCGGAELLQ
jgi:PilZ domain